MKNNGMLLVKTLLLSTNQRNIYRYTKDKKKKRKIMAGFIGTGLLYLMLMAYCIIMCMGYGAYGIIESAPVMCALLISLLAFLFTIFKTNGYLFNFREYDMLMSLPFEAKTVAASKFLYMYVKSLPWYLSISLAMMIGYGAYARPAVFVYPVWIILSLPSDHPDALRGVSGLPDREGQRGFPENQHHSDRSHNGLCDLQLFPALYH